MRAAHLLRRTRVGRIDTSESARHAPRPGRREIVVSYLELGPAFTLAGIGTSFPTLANSIMGSVPMHEAGVASGTNSVLRELGGVAGVAILGSVFTRHGGYASPHAFISGFTTAIWVAAGLSTLGILAALIIPRARIASLATAQPQPHPAPATQEAPVH